MKIKTESSGYATHIWAYIISILMSIIWIFVSGITINGSPEILSNIERYAITLILFCSIFFITSKLLEKNLSSENLNLFWEKDLTKKQSYIIIILLSFFGVLLIMLMQFNTVNTFGWQCSQSVTSLQWILTILTCLIFSGMAYIYNKVSLKSNAPRDICLILSIIFIIVTVLAAAYRNYLPNIYNNNYNWEAYWASAYAQYLGVPIDPLTNSFYGYYSVILYPFFKLAGFSVTTIAISTAIQGAFTAACACYAVWYITRKNFFIRLLGILSVLYYSIRPTTILYPQGYPSRLVFTTALIAAAAWFLKKREKRGAAFINRGILFGYLISMLGMMWSKDFGLFGIIAWGAFHIHLILSEHKFEKKDFIKLIYPVIAMILTFVFAWQIISLLNVIIWNGSPLSLSIFIYPLGSGFAEALAAKLPLNWCPWLAVLLLLLFFFSKGIASTSIIKKSPIHNSEITFGFMVSVLALGMLVYYMNRPAYDNLTMSYYALVMLLIILIKNLWSCTFNEKILFKIKRSIKATAFILCMFLISAFIVIGSMYIPRLYIKLSPYKNLDLLEEYTKEARQSFPKDSIFFGDERTLWYLQLDLPKDEMCWSSPINYTTESWKNVQDYLMNNDQTIIMDSKYMSSINYWVMSTDDIFKLYDETEEFSIGNRTYIVLTPKNNLITN